MESTVAPTGADLLTEVRSQGLRVDGHELATTANPNLAAKELRLTEDGNG